MDYSQEGAYIDDLVLFDGADNYYLINLKYFRGLIEIPLNLGYQFSVVENLNVQMFGGIKYTLFGIYPESIVNDVYEYEYNPDGREYDVHSFGDGTVTRQKSGIVFGFDLIYKNFIMFEVSYSKFLGPVDGFLNSGGLNYRMHYFNISVGLFVL